MGSEIYEDYIALRKKNVFLNMDSDSNYMSLGVVCVCVYVSVWSKLPTGKLEEECGGIFAQHTDRNLGKYQTWNLKPDLELSC